MQGRRGWLLHSVIATVVVLAFVGADGVGLARADEDTDEAARATQLIESCIAALGGPKFLGANSFVATGVFTAFVQGQPGVPLPFIDTYVLPDRNRTEFGKKKGRVIQSNAGTTGWKYDGRREVLTPQDPSEIQAFQRYIRANLYNLLRQNWRQPGVELRYLGRVEFAPRVWTEGVTIEFEDGFAVDILFDTRTKLPMASRYREGAESGAAGSLIETRYHDVYLEFDGVKTPRTVDLYRDQAQTARITYETVRYNVAIDSKYFEQPSSSKDVK